MHNSSENTPKKHLCVGLLAHVDAGKTTLSEAMLYLSGATNTLGRVDHQNTVLDTDHLERERGITIFSKQAILSLCDTELTILDTPGHVDLSTEMERTLQTLDYAILVISGTDGVQGHTETLWQLLQQYAIPTFLFVNKMDLDSADRGQLLSELQQRLNSGCIDFSADRTDEEIHEDAATCEESLLAAFLEQGALSDRAIQRAIVHRALFPCYFGSALKLDGVQHFLDGLERYTVAPHYPTSFGAKIFKISRDAQNTRLTWMKLTGGALKVKTKLSGITQAQEQWEQKVDQIRLYSGEKYRMADQVEAGMICAVTGLSYTQPGMALGLDCASPPPVLQPVLTYQVLLPEGCDVHNALRKLQQLEEEDPQLHVTWNERMQEIHLQLMGKIQLEILQRIIKDRFDLDVTFGAGSILYRETITEPVEGIGHFEPLRHYAEVHVLLEPLAPGSGLEFASVCSEDVLDRNWQRLILTHFEEKEHLGVLTGHPITDMRITLLTGRAHAKHTEGGDFRQATYRAIRQGLKKAQSVLLEPWYTLRLEVPQDDIGRAMSDIQQRGGTFDPPEQCGGTAVLTGCAPVSTMRDYPIEVAAYTGGRGRITLSVQGYRPCHNAEEVIAQIGYDSETDLENTADSVFCSHGAGHTVKWNAVEQHMHLPAAYMPKSEHPEEQRAIPLSRVHSASADSFALDKELQAIFERTYGKIQPRAFRSQRPTSYREPRDVLRQLEPATDFLLVDGYNIIFAWDDLSAIANEHLDAARQTLMDMLCNYQAYKHCEVILVFDAYRVPGQAGNVSRYHNIHVVYTKQAETADMFIERVAYELNGNRRVRVATSDGLEQIIILAHGAERVSARAFRAEMEQTLQQIAAIINSPSP